MRRHFRPSPLAPLAALAVALVTVAAPAAAQLTPAGGEVAVSDDISGPVEAPAVAASAGGRTVVLWTGECGEVGLCHRLFDAAGTALGGPALLATSTRVFDATPAVAMAAGGDFLVAWSRPTGTVTGEIAARRFALDGTPLGPERTVATQVGRLLAGPAVAALPGGGFAVVWENLRFEGFSGEVPLYSGVAVEGRRLNAAGALQGAVFRVDSAASVDLVAAPAVAADGSGRLVVAWESFGFGPEEDDILARWLDAAGTPLSDEIRVHSTSADIQDSPAVAAGPDGVALVAWESRSTAGTGPGIYARRFGLSGPLGVSETRVDSTGTGTRSAPAVAADAAGRYSVVWQGVSVLNGSVFVRHYSAGALPLGAPQTVSASAGDHTAPAVASAAAGGVTVVWRRRDQTFTRRILARRYTAPVVVEPCVEADDTLCLGPGGRFRVEVTWRNQRNGDTGVGRSIPDNPRSGYFWFFNPENVELVVKVLDGRPVNGRFWVFYGALTDVEYTLSVTDTETGDRRDYVNPPGNICGRGDTTAFPLAAVAPIALSPAGAAAAAGGELTPLAAAAGSVCGGGADDLCLLGDRFRVEVDWSDQRSGDTGSGHAVPFGPNTGFFWFFNPENIELVVKVLDGRPVNGRFWVFYGALSDVEYTIAVTDTETADRVEYTNEPGNICGRGDTTAF